MSVVGAIRRGLNARQMANATIIEQEFRSAGMPANLAAAAIVNAIHESNLNERAGNYEGESSVGLFQLNSSGSGLGRGMSVQERIDPRINTRVVVRESRRLGLHRMGDRTVPELAAIFANKVERCGECGYQDGDRQLRKREATARAIFPTRVSYGALPAIAGGLVALPGGSSSTWVLPVALGSIAASLFLVGRILRRRRSRRR